MKDLEGKNIFLLIDGNALIHRAYHGLPPLRTKKGLLVNAVYGFTTAIFSAIEKFSPKYIAVAFDVSKVTFRSEKYDQYKAHRKKMEDELANQLPLVRKICDVLNFPQIGVQGYEADDVIGTLSKKFKKEEGLNIVIVTGDMDALQLIDENVFVYSVSRGVNQAILYDEEEVRNKYGFGPRYLIDYKGLRGDPSDNIPGVCGIGDKTAKDLIIKYGTIEDIYGKLDEVSTKVRCKLETDKEKAILSKDLASIYCDIQLDFSLKDGLIADYDPERAKELFEELEFKSLIGRLPKHITHYQDKLF